MPRERNANLSADGRRRRQQAVELIERSARASNMNWPAFVAEAGRVLYGAPFDRSTAYRWKRLEAAIPSEVLVFALERSGPAAASAVGEDDDARDRGVKVEHVLKAHEQTLSDLLARVTALEEPTR